MSCDWLISWKSTNFKGVRKNRSVSKYTKGKAREPGTNDAANHHCKTETDNQAGGASLTSPNPTCIPRCTQLCERVVLLQTIRCLARQSCIKEHTVVFANPSVSHHNWHVVLYDKSARTTRGCGQSFSKISIIAKQVTPKNVLKGWTSPQSMYHQL